MSPQHQTLLETILSISVAQPEFFQYLLPIHRLRDVFINKTVLVLEDIIMIKDTSTEYRLQYRKEMLLFTLLKI